MSDQKRCPCAYPVTSPDPGCYLHGENRRDEPSIASDILVGQLRAQARLDAINATERLEALETVTTEVLGPLMALASMIRQMNLANGWEVPQLEDWNNLRRIPTFLCLIHSEVSEALEGFRHGDKENVAEELADALIRVLDLAVGLGIDLDTEVRDKLEINKKRGYKHGGKAI